MQRIRIIYCYLRTASSEIIRAVRMHHTNKVGRFVIAGGRLAGGRYFMTYGGMRSLCPEAGQTAVVQTREDQREKNPANLRVIAVRAFRTKYPRTEWGEQRKEDSQQRSARQIQHTR
jgi:hypothetical protein